MPPPERPPRPWLHLAAFFLVAAAWALALPANGTYDEKDHIARAYAVLTGQLTPSHTVVDRRDDVKPAFLVPASLLPPNANVDCPWSPRPARSAACQHWSADHTRVLTPSGAARYSPAYYLLVGAPLVAAPDLTGIVLSRLLSALAAAALLAGAVGAALRLGSRLLAVGVALVSTPMTADLAGSVNPNGLEIAAGVAACSALLALVRAPDDRLDDRAARRLLTLTAVASLVLLTVRQLGPALLALIVLACAALARPGRLRALLRRPAAWWTVAAWGAGLAVSVGWWEYSGLTQVAAVPRDAQHLPPARITWLLTTWRIPFYLKQLVGQFGYGETSPPPLTVIAWYALLAAVVLPCLWYGTRRLLLATAGLGAGCLALLVALELHYLPVIGWFAHGRYAMPAAAGVVLCAASAGQFERHLAARLRLRRYCTTLVTAAGALHVFTLAFVMTRFRAGPVAWPSPFEGQWTPPLGPLVPLLAVAAGVTMLALLSSAPSRRYGILLRPARTPWGPPVPVG
ncbi:DUF2142 domain-containing protein [Dactylosporangium salmoneum]|uniref:Membrane protein DUF2142 n=1 Tax=Dactylosporangium salmoneum TaxID=53361 RepID=A0ABP5ULM6_9ACTN